MPSRCPTKRMLHVAVLLVALVSMGGPATGDDFLRGADISFLPQVETGGGVFRDGGVARDLLAILADRGINTIRLRLWHSPGDGHSGLAEALALAARARDAGCGILLDFHYSDTWADPGHQTKPAAWAMLSASVLADSLRAYTRDVLLAFAAAGAPPAMVQLGNEITPGMLWNDGRVGGSFDTPQQWDQLGALLRAALAGVDDALPGSQRPQIMIHIDRGGDNAGARWFYDNLLAQGIAFDVIGLSYYPWWHGTLADLQANLDDLAGRYGKDLVVVETAYPWTLGWFDDTHNLVGLPEHLLPGYPDTPAGQRAFLEQVLAIVRDVPDGRGRGVCWWAPAWIASPGFGSAWENLALFDETGEALTALDAFASVASAAEAPIRTGLRLTPNPFTGQTTFFLGSAAGAPHRFEVFDARGRRLVDRRVPDGRDAWTWRAEGAAAGTYFVRLSAPGRSWTAKATLQR